MTRRGREVGRTGHRQEGSGETAAKKSAMHAAPTEPICLHLFEQFHKNRGTIQHMDFTLGSGSITGKGQNMGVLRFAHPVVFVCDILIT